MADYDKTEERKKVPHLPKKKVAQYVALGVLGVASVCYLFKSAPYTSSSSQAMTFQLQATGLGLKQLSPIQHRSALMAPILFPQLYPACGRITHPPIPTIKTKEERKSYFNSQCKEDMILHEDEFHKDHEPGVFLEIGALDGTMGSNTLFYERALGWRGILVKGHPVNAAKLQTSNRNRTARFSVATCNIPDDQTPGSLIFTGAGRGMATVRDLASPEFLEKCGKALGNDSLTVPCVPLQYMIEATGLYDIDLFSLDVEGGEFAVLQTIDFDVTNIRLIIVEFDRLNPTKDQNVRQLLADKGFVTVPRLNKRFDRCLQNEVFVHPKYWARKAAREPIPIQC